MTIDCDKCGKININGPRNPEYVILKHPIWRKITSTGRVNHKDIICKECIEEELGECISQKHLMLCPVNYWNPHLNYMLPYDFTFEEGRSLYGVGKEQYLKFT